MAIRAVATWEAGNARGGEQTAGNTAPTWNSTSPISGTYDGDVSASGTNTSYFNFGNVIGDPNTWKAVGGLDVGATAYLSCYAKALTLPSSTQSEYLVRVLNSTAGAFKGNLIINDSGQVKIRDNAGTDSSYSTATLGSTAKRLDFKIPTGSSGVTGELRIAESVEATLTGNYNTSNPFAVRLGKGSNLNSQTVNYRFDSFVLGDAGYAPAGYQIAVLRPTGIGSYTDFDSSGGGPAVIGDVNTVPWGATPYSTSTAADQQQSYTFESTASKSVSGTIHAVAVGMTLANGGSTAAVKPFIKSGATTSFSTSTSDPAAANAYNHVFETDPNTSSAWTTSAIDALEVGVSNDATSSGDVRISGVAIYVVYTPAGGTIAPASLEFDYEVGSALLTPYQIAAVNAEFDYEIDSVSIAGALIVNSTEFDYEVGSAAIVIGLNVQSAEFDHEVGSVSLATGLVVNNAEFDHEVGSVALVKNLVPQSSEFDYEVQSAELPGQITVVNAEFDFEATSAGITPGINVQSAEFDFEVLSVSLTPGINVQSAEFDFEVGSVSLPVTGQQDVDDAEFDFEVGSAFLRQFGAPANTPKSRVKLVRECC